ncbi:MAG: ATP-binding protein, partial [Planctomycetota bacterium]
FSQFSRIIEIMRSTAARQSGDYDRLQLVLRQMNDGVMLLDEQQNIVLANAAARGLLQMRQTDPEGRTLLEVARFPRLSEAVASVVDGGDRKATLQQEMDTDSVRRYLRIDVIRLSGSSRGVLLSLRDETEARLLEAMRREFIANVSHELKTPLSAIKGSAETARSAIDADDEDGAHHFLAQVDNECRRIENLIQDMMHLAKAQSGQSSFNKVPVSLRDVINESMQTNVLIAEAKTIDIAAEFRVSTEDPAIVLADREAMLQIINNLLGNALRYTAESGAVSIALSETPKTWEIDVTDNGIGIAEEEQPRVFERFYRGERSRQSAAGTGMGLAIVKHMTLAMSGKIHLKSTVGVGSTFTVSFPKLEQNVA